jgi:hypothetical protein
MGYKGAQGLLPRVHRVFRGRFVKREDFLGIFFASTAQIRLHLNICSRAAVSFKYHCLGSKTKAFI